MKGKILLPLDGTPESLKAFMPAKSIADLLDMNLYILHISEKSLSRQEVLDKLCINPEDLHCFVISHKTGNPAKVILEESEKCSYIVMNIHTKHAGEASVIGSTTMEVISSTYKPVILINPNACINTKDNKWLPKKILIPLNGVPGSAQALYPVMDILSKTSAEIELLHIYEEKSEPIKEEGGFATPYYVDYPQHEWPGWAQEFLKRFCPCIQNRNHIKIGVSLSRGTPADEITDFVKKNNIDFIAVAWHGDLSHYRAKVLKKVLLETSCPIMLIRIKDEKD